MYFVSCSSFLPPARLLNWLAAHRSRDKGLTYFYVHGFESGMDNSPRFDSRGLGLGSFLVGAG